MRKGKDTLIGKRAAVHPRLTTDPIGCQGHTGKVVAVNENAITVIFDDEKTGAYAPDGLLILLPKETILRDLVATNQIITHRDCKLTLQVSSLLAERRYDEAIRLAILNDTTQTLCTINCEAWLQRSHMKEKNMTIRL